MVSLLKHIDVKTGKEIAANAKRERTLLPIFNIFPPHLICIYGGLIVTSIIYKAIYPPVLRIRIKAYRKAAVSISCKEKMMLDKMLIGSQLRLFNQKEASKNILLENISDEAKTNALLFAELMCKDELKKINRKTKK